MLGLTLGAALVLTYILGHFGDYVTQSDWMANTKTKNSVPAAVHALVYTIPFVLVTTEPIALALIGGSHFVIDRWRLARYVCWGKNFLAPRSTANGNTEMFLGGASAVAEDGRLVTWDPCTILTDKKGRAYIDGVLVGTAETKWWHPWSECSGTGYHRDRPQFMAVWLMIKADNNLHQLINFFTVLYLGGLV